MSPINYMPTCLKSMTAILYFKCCFSNTYKKMGWVDDRFRVVIMNDYEEIIITRLISEIHVQHKGILKNFTEQNTVLAK